MVINGQWGSEMGLNEEFATFERDGNRGDEKETSLSFVPPQFFHVENPT